MIPQLPGSHSEKSVPVQCHEPRSKHVPSTFQTSCPPSTLHCTCLVLASHASHCCSHLARIVPAAHRAAHCTCPKRDYAQSGKTFTLRDTCEQRATCLQNFSQSACARSQLSTSTPSTMSAASIVPFSERALPDTICLFDVDGTLTPARLEITDDVKAGLAALRKKCAIGFVGGSDLSKQKEQLGDDVLNMFDYCFSENGLTAYKFGKELASQSFINWIGEDKYNKLVKFILRYLSDIDLPKRRGTFVEFRNGMINVSPIGRNASTAERLEYEQFDLQHKVRENLVNALKKEFADYGLTYSIGGQISFDVFPTGWDKTYCLRHIEDQHFKHIHFFGDKTYKGGNDYEIYTDDRTIGHAVSSPADTLKIIKEEFLKE